MKEPVRVLRVVGTMDRGGLESIIMNSYRIIDREKLQFDFVMHTDRECAFNDEIRSLGGRIYRVPKYTGINHLEYTKAWKKLFEEHPEYKVIHGHVRSTASIYLKIAKKYGLTTIAHSHNTSSGKGVSAMVKNILQLPIRYNVDYMFACSIPAGQWLFGKNVINKPNFRLVPNGIDVSKYKFDPVVRSEIREYFGIRDEFVIGHVGRLHEQKNHTFLIDIFKEINNRNPNTVLMLVGEGYLREKIEWKIEEYGLKDKVILTGSRNDVPKLLQAMDIFVFPSLYEGFGNVIIEAQAAGLQCIISDTIPKEVKLTSLVKFNMLNNDAHYWADKVMDSLKSGNRKNTSKEIIESGYDIVPITNWYEKFYIDHSLRSK